MIDDAAGRPVCASLARITCEMYLVADPDAGTPRERYARILALHDAGARDLLSRGFDDAHAWLPPPIARRFGRRLEALGWTPRRRLDPLLPPPPLICISVAQACLCPRNSETWKLPSDVAGIHLEGDPA